MYKYNLDCYIVVSLFFQTPLHGWSLTLYSSLWTILILHLLIIWAFTWVSVPSNTFSSFLWVVVVKATLFKGLFNINVARKVTAVYSMQWQQLFLRYFWVPITLIRVWCTSLPLELPGRSHWLLEYRFELHYHVRGDIPPRNTLSFIFYSLSPRSKPFITIRLSSDYWCSRPRPNTQYTI